MKSLQLHGDHLVMEIKKKSIPVAFIIFLFVALWSSSLWPNVGHPSLLAIKFELKSSGFEAILNKIRILLASRKQSLDAEYVTNNTHHISLPNSLPFYMGLFVYLIMLLAG